MKTKTEETVCLAFQLMVEETIASGVYAQEKAKMHVAQRIYDAMKLQGVSKAELARRLGSSRAYITRILQGDVNFTIDSLVKIGGALNCDLEFGDLFVGRSQAQPTTTGCSLELTTDPLTGTQRDFISPLMNYVDDQLLQVTPDEKVSFVA